MHGLPACPATFERNRVVLASYHADFSRQSEPGGLRELAFISIPLGPLRIVNQFPKLAFGILGRMPRPEGVIRHGRAAKAGWPVQFAVT